jgi:hypothetical protein
MGWSNPFRRSVVRRPPSPSSSEPDVPWVLLICVLVMALTFAVVIPVLGIMYMDMNNALYRAEHETRKMKELRLKVLREMRGE